MFQKKTGLQVLSNAPGACLTALVFFHRLKKRHQFSASPVLCLKEVCQ